MGKKSKSPSPFEGRWRIVSMTTWDEDYFNEEVQAFVEFEKNGTGHFQFGYVQGYMDWRPATRDGAPAVEWSWEGNDEMDEAQGDGWAELQPDGSLEGAICFHDGDEANFIARRWTSSTAC